MGMPTDIGQQYEVDNVLAAVEDYRTEAYTVIFGVLGGAPDAAKIARLKDVVLPQHFTNLERLLGADDYFVANTLSVADLGAFDIITNFSFNLSPSSWPSPPAWPRGRRWPRISRVPSTPRCWPFRIWSSKVVLWPREDGRPVECYGATAD